MSENSDRATRLDSVMLHVMLRTGGPERLREIAAELGAVAPSGPVVGQGSISTLLRRIVAGDLVVCRRPGEEDVTA